ncbi:NAD(P)-binding protein [Thozetella sp. PMI_491]|nr:NAD(P)-binding protein [Thozetella sp. PMI_491]
MYKKVGIFGSTGLLGQEVTRALVDEGFEVVPFSRQQTIGHKGMEDQIPLIQQAKKDGVRRFIPSEFGVDHRAVKADFFKPKMRVFEAVEEADFPDGWTAIGSGFFEAMIPQFVLTLAESSKITVRGTGQQQHPFTVRYDIGRVLAHTFRDTTNYKNSWLTIINGWFSLGEIAQIIKEKSGPDMQVEHVEIDAKTPVLKLLEVDGIELFDRNAKFPTLPFELADLKAYIK